MKPMKSSRSRRSRRGRGGRRRNRKGGVENTYNGNQWLGLGARVEEEREREEARKAIETIGGTVDMVKTATRIKTADKTTKTDNIISRQPKKREEKLSSKVRELMEVLASEYRWEFDEEAWKNTPGRVAATYEEWDGKRRYDKMTTFVPEERFGGMVIMRGISYFAVCEHHLLPFDGVADIGYIPGRRQYGASKLARIVAKAGYCATTQERMTRHILDMIEEDDVMVVLRGGHQCMKCRGVEQRSAVMITSDMKGGFKRDSKVRMEMLELLK